MDAEAGTRHSETLRTDIRPKNPTPLGVGDVNIKLLRRRVVQIQMRRSLHNYHHQEHQYHHKAFF